jgi:hypothetical protein
MIAKRLRVALTLVAVVAVAARVVAQAPEMRKLDTGLGFSVSVPASWTVGSPSGKNRFVAGNRDEDFSLVVTDFGPVPADAAEAEKVYQASFGRYGLALEATADIAVGGANVRRYVFSMKADGADAHAEVVMLPVGGTTYAVMVVTPKVSADARRAVIGKVFESIVVK